MLNRGVVLINSSLNQEMVINLFQLNKRKVLLNIKSIKMAKM
jgi:hypothetical protein